MFGAGPSTPHQSSGLPGTILIPMRFVWPYGGRRVFLSGSFTRCGIAMIKFLPTVLSFWNVSLNTWYGFIFDFLCVQVVRAYTYVSGGGMPNCFSSCLELNARISPGVLFTLIINDVYFTRGLLSLNWVCYDILSFDQCSVKFDCTKDKQCTMCLLQYKFYVDGEWRHNEQQPFVTGNIGIVNTLFLGGGEPDMVPTIFSPETSGRSNMDVDDVFTRLVSILILLKLRP